MNVMAKKRINKWAMLGLCVVLNGAVHAEINWQKMPLLSPEAKKTGVFPGGEGSQWPRGAVVVSASDPDFLLLPIDVGGLYRSLDGGRHWEMSLQGWNARGANAFAIDPRNASHVLGIGGNSMDWGENWGPSPNGVYLSNDQAASWQHVLASLEGIGGTVAFDGSSFDGARKICTMAYFLSANQGLFKSEDGGQIWKSVARGDAVLGRLDRDWTQGGTVVSTLKVDGKTGALYIGGGKGLFKSEDDGKTWQMLRGDEIHGLDLGSDGAVFISGKDKIGVSRDGGKTFASLPCAGLDTLGGKPVEGVRVSPADAKRLLCWVAGDNWQWPRYVSHDGGATFQKVVTEKGAATLPMNARQGYFAWHPTDANIAFCLGGDWVTRSADGGQNFTWWNNGYNGIMLGASFNFSAHEPDTVFLGFQDYNGAFTNDGGATWNYRDISGKGWGGHCYGAHAVDKNLMWYGDAEGWNDKRRLRLSRDGGATWDFAKDDAGKIIEWNGAQVSFSDPKNANILFASNWRSADKGATWQAMANCDGVFIAAPDGMLIGKKGDAIITSRDSGATWQNVASVPGGFADIAYDHKRKRFYVASEDRLKQWQNGAWKTLDTPHNQYDGIEVVTVAVDPVMPDVVYAGGPSNVLTNQATVVRSTDGGATWANLTTGNGPHEVAMIRVHPKTREAWLNGQCFGMWKIAPPAQLGAAPAELANAQPAPHPPTVKALLEAAKFPVP